MYRFFGQNVKISVYVYVRIFLWVGCGGQLKLLLSQKPMISLHVKFQPSSTPPSDRFWWGVVLLVLLLLVTGVKQSQLLV